MGGRHSLGPTLGRRDGHAAAQKSGDRFGQHRWIEWMGHHCVSPRPGSQPGILWSSGENQNRRAAKHFVLHGATHSHSPGGSCLAIENDEVDSSLRHPPSNHGLGCHLHVLDARQFRRGSTPQGGLHRHATIGIAAVEKNGEGTRLRIRFGGHERDGTGRDLGLRKGTRRNRLAPRTVAYLRRR